MVTLMNIITFANVKGGVGKSTLTFNYGAWLAKQGHKVLLIDSDPQVNLSSTFNQITDSHNLNDVFVGPDTANIIPVDHDSEQNNLFLLPGSVLNDQLDEDLATKVNKDFLMTMYMQDHISDFESFDYILIDTHPKFDLLTRNMIAVSDTVVVPLEPAEYGFVQAKSQFDFRMKRFRDEVIDHRTRESMIDAKVIYVGNKVKHNTNASRQFIDQISTMDEVVTYIPNREIMNTTTLAHTALFDMNDQQIGSHKKFRDDLNDRFNVIKEQTTN